MICIIKDKLVNRGKKIKRRDGVKTTRLKGKESIGWERDGFK